MSPKPEPAAAVLERVVARLATDVADLGVDASRVILVTRAKTTDRGWDRVVRTAFPPPKPE